MSSGYGYGDGGGYMPHDGMSTSPQQSKKSNLRDRKTLQSLTVKQLSTAQATSAQDGYMVDGQALSMVKIVGRVMDVQDGDMSRISFLLTDSTSSISLVKYRDNTEDGGVAPAVEVVNGTFVEVITQVKMSSSGPLYVVETVRPMAEGNLLTAHMLDTVLTHLYHTRGPLPPTNAVAGGGAGGAGGGAAAYASGFASSSAAASIAASGSLAGTSFGGVGVAGHAGSDQDAVLDYFRGFADTELGSSIQECHRDCAPVRYLPVAKLRNLVEALVNAGLLFTTLDDEHYKCTS